MNKSLIRVLIADNCSKVDKNGNCNHPTYEKSKKEDRFEVLIGTCMYTA